MSFPLKKLAKVFRFLADTAESAKSLTQRHRR